ncbi:MAG: glycoside hydrolase family 43 protein [Abitibacteriaceae bacterium]|nr:glycoside hydrolase family 43 protein [Abditibacteriaceae bacterium]MBV9868968.1 glycoside hydrolase family 43 protein [Abditibacteriaceae bacterium]
MKANQPEMTWVEFTSFEYEGWDRVAERLAPASEEFLNPILAGFYADPSICGVAGDYYLVNSSFSYFPGVPIFHSTDLVHWTQLGHVLDRPSQLNLDGLGVSRGIFAPDISYHDGQFYMVTTMVDAGGNFYVTARDPAGPWSEPVWLPQVNGIDPSFFWDDDGHAYLMHNGPPPDNKPLYDGHRAIWLWEFDAQSGAVQGEGRILVNGGTDLAQKPVWIEGPHLFKRNGYYYLCAAEGGTSTWHSQVIFRSRAVGGPYEPFQGNPILTQRDLDPARPDPVTSVGHADFVVTPEGEWWAVFLGCRPYEGNFYNIGRETFLLPVTWENDWPMILERGQVVPRIVPKPNLPAAPEPSMPLTGSFSWRDDFEVETLDHAWNILRTPREKWRSLTVKPGSLLIAPRAVSLHSVPRKDVNANGNPSFITRRQQHRDFSAMTTLVVNPATAPCEAGLAALQNDTNYFFLGVRINEGSAHQVFLERHTNKSTGPELLASVTLPAGVHQVELKVEGADRAYGFSYLLPEGDWVSLQANVDGSILSTEAAGGFVGTYLGPFARLSSPAQRT